MYEGCNKTALTSQSAIADALLNLMEEKPYTRISVSEICKSAGVSRQTFYTLFASKDNVIAYELERKYCFRPEEHECCQSSMSLEDICHAYSYYITERRDILGLLVRNDILYLLQESLFNWEASPASRATMSWTSTRPPGSTSRAFSTPSSAALSSADLCFDRFRAIYQNIDASF